MTATISAPDPSRIFDVLTAFQQTMAMKGAIELEIFTHIADGAATAAEIGKRCEAAERGVRILCDYLAIQGFLHKVDGRYELTGDSALFLNKRSPAYMGSMAKFLTDQSAQDNFRDVAAAVRKGGTIRAEHAHMEPDNPIWVEFARSMAPMAAMEGRAVAEIVGGTDSPMKVLDIAASHGLYGIHIALKNPSAQIVGVDWKNVLPVALENAERMGVGSRYSTIPGSAFEVDFGSGYGLVLLPNFLHHFDRDTNIALLKKIRAAMEPEAMLAIVEFVPNPDRVTPRTSAAFSLIMLTATEAGDAYTFAEFEDMLQEAGFQQSRVQDLEPSPQQLILARA